MSLTGRVENSLIQRRYTGDYFLVLHAQAFVESKIAGIDERCHEAGAEFSAVIHLCEPVGTG
jgi:hypothetical protein